MTGSHSTPTPAAESVAEAFVEAFAQGWRAPGGADQFADHFEPWLDPDIRFSQPPLPSIVGRGPFRERFARPLFELIPDLHGTVEGWAVRRDTVYVELRLEGTVGRRAVTLHSCDRITLRDGRAIERVAHLDPGPVLRAVALNPRAWPRILRRQLIARRTR
jgi:SnoaL-like domain